MKKYLMTTFVLVLITLLAVLTGCSGPGAAPSSSSAPTSTTSTPPQAIVTPSQVAPVISPVVPPPVSAPGIPPQSNPVVLVPAPATAPSAPSSGGTSAPGIAVPPVSAGAPGIAVPPAAAAAPNMAASAPFASPNYQPSYVQAASGGVQSTGIWVNGLGQVSATPDTASLTLGVDSQAVTVAEAQNNASTSMNAVMQVLKNKGIAAKDITTVGFNINPTYNYKNNTITGYQVSNTIIAKIRNIADAGSIIDGVTAAGGNLIRVNSISFSVDDPTPFMKQARQLAVDDAATRAKQLAASTGVKLGFPTFVTETSGNYVPSPVYFGASSAMAAPATPINPGQTQISVNVQIVYAIQ